MGQKKLQRFEAIKSFPNVFQYPENVSANWHKILKNNNPITLELACGKGEYTIGLARLHPDRNFIGVDLKGNRLYVGAKTALEEKLTNTAFLRIQIGRITEYFAAHEVTELWITFPDPQLRRSKAKKRLTHPKFLRMFQHILQPGGLIHLKTDSPDLFNFTKLVIDKYGLILHEERDDVHAGTSLPDELKIKTHYEGLDIAESRKIHYLKFSLPTVQLADDDTELHELIKADDPVAG
jgi:tRNA (guanine-N7-)-methyltransferase